MDTQRPAAPARGRPFADRALDGLFDDGPQSKPGDQPAVAAIPAQAASITAAAAKDPWAAWRNLQQTSEAAAPGPVQPAPAQPEASARPVVEAAAPPVNGAAPASATPAPVPGSESTSNAGPWKPLPSVKPGFYPPTSPNAPRRQPSSFAAAFPRNPGMAEPAVSDPVNAAPDKPKDDGAMPASAALNGSAPAKDTSRLAASTLNGSAVSGEPAATSEAAPFASAIAATAAAANQALEKLNAGLTDTPAAAAPVSTPVVQAAAPSPSVAPPSVAAPGLTAGRTLDDMVGDMLRPMLEKWVEANMPRLMEKALRPVPPKDNGSPKA